MIAKSDDYRAVINALWTLEGLGAVSLQAVKSGLKNSNEKVRMNAIAVSEFINETERSACWRYSKRKHLNEL